MEGNLVVRVKQYASRISDIQLTAVSSSDINFRSFSSILARLDNFADNSVTFQSLVSSFDQFRLLSECHFFSFEDQLRY